MGASALAAFILPFEVFLVSYAVLGPLHYLTEISWLHDREYFLAGKRDSLPLMLLCGAMLLVSIVGFPGAEKNDLITMLNYAAFAGAAALLITRTGIARVIAFALIMGSFLIVRQSDLSMIFSVCFFQPSCTSSSSPARSSCWEHCEDEANPASSRRWFSRFVRRVYFRCRRGRCIEYRVMSAGHMPRSSI